MDTQATHLIDTSRVTGLKTPGQMYRLFAMQGGSEQELLLQEAVGSMVLPVATLERSSLAYERTFGSTGLQTLIMEGGGRGPIINYGETVTLAMLLPLLSQALQREQLHPKLIEELDNITSLVSNTQEQSGYAKHNDVITLDAGSVYLPAIRLEPAPGTQMHITHTHVGEEPNCITYVEIPQQEFIFGHGGVVNRQFTVKAAILEKALPTVVSLGWTPAPVAGPPLSILTTESVPVVTAVNCMGLRVKGNLTLTNNKGLAVSGAMYAQIQVDGGAWTSIAMLHKGFPADVADSVTTSFDIILAYDQEPHTYKFRGQLITESGLEVERELIGGLSIDTVTEFGSGAVLSYEPLLRWDSKEKL